MTAFQHWKKLSTNYSTGREIIQTTLFFVREWRNLHISQFKTDGTSRYDALERLYERAVTLQDQLDDVH